MATRPSRDVSFAYSLIVILAVVRSRGLLRRVWPQLGAVAEQLELALAASARSIASYARRLARQLLAAFVVIGTLSSLSLHWLVAESGQSDSVPGVAAWTWGVSLLCLAAVLVAVSRPKPDEQLKRVMLHLAMLLAGIVVLPVFHGLWALDLRAGVLAHAPPVAYLSSPSVAILVASASEVVVALAVTLVVARLALGPPVLAEARPASEVAATGVTLKPAVDAIRATLGSWVFVSAGSAVFLAFTNDWRVLLWVAIWPDLLAFTHERMSKGWARPVRIIGARSWSDVVSWAHLILSMIVGARAFGFDHGFVVGPAEPPYLRAAVEWAVTAAGMTL